MSTKKSLTPLIIILLGLVGIVSAGSLMSDLPDTPSFPRNPSATGTLGYVLGLFGTDGTAPNTEKLGGRSASGYLQNTYCADSVWNGINPDGTAHCKQPLLAFAEIYEGSMQVNGVTKPVGTILYEGDKLETNATQTGTIRFTNAPRSTGFTPDISIARIGENSTVFIDRGDTAGTLALITLEDGLLWGRVLTSTGINFGGNTVIAGVRGTSIRMWADRSTSQTRMAVIDSASSTPTGLTWKDPVEGGGVQSLEAGQRELGISSGAANTMTVSLFSELSPTNTSPLAQWTQSNLRADLDYLIKLKSTSSPAVLERLNAEIGSLTQSGTTIQSTFEEMACADAPEAGSTLWRSLLDQGNSRKDSCRQGVLAYADFTQKPNGLSSINENVISLYTKDVSMVPMTETGATSAMDSGNFYASLNGDTSAFPKPKNRVWDLTTYNEWPVCKSGSAPFICGYIQGLYGDKKYSSVYIKKSTGMPNCSGLMCSYSGLSMRTHLGAYNSVSGTGAYKIVAYSDGGGIKIDQNGQYLSYPLTQLTDEIGSLTGKTIEIEYDGTFNSSITQTIISFGIGKNCLNAAGGTLGCTSSSGIPSSNFSHQSSDKKFTIVIPSSGATGIDQIIIGNNRSSNSSTNLTQPFKNNIKKITIK